MIVIGYNAKNELFPVEPRISSHDQPGLTVVAPSWLPPHLYSLSRAVSVVHYLLLVMPGTGWPHSNIHCIDNSKSSGVYNIKL